jgi:hypothetical protein
MDNGRLRMPTIARSSLTVALAMTAAAALHADTRGRVVLGAEWLDRWKRSRSPFPSDVPAAAHPALGERIAGLPQFRVA